MVYCFSGPSFKPLALVVISEYLSHILSTPPLHYNSRLGGLHKSLSMVKTIHFEKLWTKFR